MRISDWSSDVCSSDLKSFVNTASASKRATELSTVSRSCGCRRTTENRHVTFAQILQRRERCNRNRIWADRGPRLGRRHRGAYRRRRQPHDQLGRASCRGRVCQYVELSVAAVLLKKKHKKITSRKTSQP